ncbi:porin family protein [Hymenobacter negativus]|uniref:PorT family protein n=1 Tax=Hymenobacter negativus TaxID=2795026 RepID=A0ABS3QFG2_9BACT|nr:porin family protein [Hymenobacter negativus]MBO2009907.1 PorT family protein [Hymenobacter negativus]
MSTKLVATVLLMALASWARAQPGIKAGVGYATLSTFNWSGAYREASATGRFGFHVGAFYERPLAGRWTLVPEVSYSYQQLDLQVEDNSVQDAGYFGRYRLQLGYLNVPVLARATFGRWYLELGPHLGILINAHEKGTETVGGFMGSTTAAVDRAAADRYLRADLGLGAGGGVKLPAGFALSLRATTGLLSLTEESSASNNYSGSLRNQVLQLGVAYQFKQEAH